MAIEVEVLDLGINNLASLCRGLVVAGALGLRTVAAESESRGADLLVLPGVGAYGAAIDELKSRGLDGVVQNHVASGGFLFGVCLGMQLLGSASEESPEVVGLGLIPGQVRKLVPSPTTRVPNMGWNGVRATDKAEEFPTLHQQLDFYFVHSYAMEPDSEHDVLITSEFGGSSFVSGVLRDKILGLQFHPEKSSRAGNRLLADVVAWAHG